MYPIMTYSGMGGGGYSQGRASYSHSPAIYSSPISKIEIDNPIRESAIYKSGGLGVTYIGGVAYHAPSGSGPIHQNNQIDMMFDSRASQQHNLQQYMPFDGYLNTATNTSSSYHVSNSNYPKIIFTPNDFLRPGRPQTRWVGGFEEVKEIVEKIYRDVTGNELPHVEINIVPAKELYMEYEKSGNKADEALQGFYGNGRIFVKEGKLDEMILTLGHELGHASSAQLANPELEEAKAYAFTEAWVKTIVENNVENLAECITIARSRSSIPEWAKVHLHGFKEFRKRLDNGLAPLEIIDNLIAIDNFKNN